MLVVLLVSCILNTHLDRLRLSSLYCLLVISHFKKTFSVWISHHTKIKDMNQFGAKHVELELLILFIIWPKTVVICAHSLHCEGYRTVCSGGLSACRLTPPK